MIGKALLSGLCAPCWAVGVPSSFLTLAHVSLSVSPFFHHSRCDTALSLVCFEVTICELLCLDGLRHVISGILAGGIPGFRMVLLLLRSPSGMQLNVLDDLAEAMKATEKRNHLHPVGYGEHGAWESLYLQRLNGWFTPGLQIILNANTVCFPLLGGCLVHLTTATLLTTEDGRLLSV